MLRSLAVLAILAGAAGAQTEARIKAVENGLTTAVVAKGHPSVPKTIEDRLKTYHVPGVSVAVIHGYKIDWAKGYGVMDLATKEAVRTDTRFQAGSISKPVAAVAAMKLVEEGKLALDEDVNRKLQSWKVPDNDFTKRQKVTLRRIMSHSAGLSVHGFPGYQADAAVPSLVEVLDGRPPANTPPIRVDVEPGSIWRYSGGGYTVMQRLMTDVTGEAFPALMSRLVLGRIGMADSTYEQPLPPALRKRAATGYTATRAPIPGKYHTYPEMAAAGLWTTPSDLARFGIEIQNSRTGGSNSILTKPSVSEMLTVQKGEWGLGFTLTTNSPTPRFSHGGADEGFRAECVFDFNGDGAVVMTNSDNGSSLAREIIQSVGAAYGWRNMVPRQREAIALDFAALQKFAGQYQSPQLGLATLRVEGDHLLGSSAAFTDLEFYPLSAVKFFPLTGGFPEITFIKNAQGEVTGATTGEITATRVSK